MKAKPQLSRPFQSNKDRYWQASAAGDANAEQDIPADEAIWDYPRSGSYSTTTRRPPISFFFKAKDSTNMIAAPIARIT
jgi:hypothetical protein